jgi:hypothetical protein
VISKDQINRWLKDCQTMLDRHYAINFPNLDVPELIIAGGRKYLKIQVKSVGGSENNKRISYRAFAFINMTNGDLLKPATWKAPAKHARGNIFDSDGGMKWVTPYGMAYLEAMKT